MLLPIVPVSEPIVRYTKQRSEIFKLQEDEPTYKLLDLWRDPSLIQTRVKKIIPLHANDNDLVPADGIIAIGKEVNLITLALETSNPSYGNDRRDRSDLVAEMVMLEAIEINIKDGGTIDENFLLEVRPELARLTINNNNQDVATRVLNETIEAYLARGTRKADGTDSALFGTITTPTSFIEEDEGLKLRLHVTASVNLRTSVALVTVTMSDPELHIDPTKAAPSSAWQQKFNEIQDKITVIGAKLDARYNEENMRKSDTSIQVTKQAFAYEIPKSRNVLVNYSFQQEKPQETVAMMTAVLRIGQSKFTINTIKNTLVSAKKHYDDFMNGRSTIDPRNLYVAGDKVQPYVVIEDLDLTVGDATTGQMQTLRDADRSGDIKERALLFLNSIIAEIESNSYINQQLINTRPHYTLVTSNDIMDNVLAQYHFHNHLDNNNRPNDAGYEYRLVLPCGAILDIFTTTDIEYARQMMLYPVLPDDKNSELNFGSVRDYGTLVGHYTPVNGTAAFLRMFASCREMPIPTNPVGAIINVKGLASATFRD